MRWRSNPPVLPVDIKAREARDSISLTPAVANKMAHRPNLRTSVSSVEK
jgi:hypothetical protein